MLSGFDQSSVLDHLFLTYVNGVTSIPASPDAQNSLLTDDFLLYKPISTPCDLDSFQEDVAAVKQWSHDSHLTLNPTKYKWTLFSRRISAALHNISLQTWETGEICTAYGIAQFGQLNTQIYFAQMDL